MTEPRPEFLARASDDVTTEHDRWIPVYTFIDRKPVNGSYQYRRRFWTRHPQTGKCVEIPQETFQELRATGRIVERIRAN